MQTKNNIKQMVFFALSLIIGEGVFGMGLYWPFLFLMKDKKNIFWISFLCGLVLSSIYKKGFGLMSLFLVGVAALANFFINNGKGSGLLILAVSILANLVFDLAFNLHWSLLEFVIMILVGMLANRDRDVRESIRVNY